MNHANQQSPGTYSGGAMAPEPGPTPMTRDLNVLGENIARLEHTLDGLRKQLDPVIRPASEPSATGMGSDKPQLVKARSSVGNSLEGYAGRVETLIQRVQYLQASVEV